MAALIFFVCIMFTLGVIYPLFMVFVWLAKRASGSRENLAEFMKEI